MQINLDKFNPANAQLLSRIEELIQDSEELRLIRELIKERRPDVPLNYNSKALDILKEIL